MNLFVEISHLLSDYLIHSRHNKKSDVIENLGHLHSQGISKIKMTLNHF